MNATLDRPISPDSDQDEGAPVKAQHDAIMLATLQRRYRAQLRSWADYSDVMSLDGIDCLMDMVRALHGCSDAATLTKRMDGIARRLCVSDPVIYCTAVKGMP